MLLSMSWELLDAEGNEIVSGTGDRAYSTAVSFLCKVLGEYTFNAIDSYGDGWDGATFAVSTICDGVETSVCCFNDVEFTFGLEASEVLYSALTSVHTYGFRLYRSRMR